MRRQSAPTLRSATVYTEPLCLTCLTSKVERHGCGNDDIRIFAGDIDMPCLAERDAVARSPKCSPSASTSLHQSSAAVGPCQTWGDIPSRICMGSAQVAAIAVESPLLKASTYCSTANHWIVRGRHDVVSALSWGHTLVLHPGVAARATTPHQDPPASDVTRCGTTGTTALLRKATGPRRVSSAST